jgi:hypothetical protein
LTDTTPQHNQRYWESYDPGRFHLDETPAHIAAGANWTENYTQTHHDFNGTPVTPKQAVWTVQNVAEQVTVPAGTFTCLRIVRQDTGDTPDYYWFARGVGKVKEQHTKLEELMSVSMPP